MGQYYLTVNLDKREYLYPHKFGDGLKLLEFGDSGGGTMTGLAILLADGNGRGGGDLDSENPIVGSWAGDRIVIAGDYADEGRFVEPGHGHDNDNLHIYASEHFTDISGEVIKAMCDDLWLRKGLEDRGGRFSLHPDMILVAGKTI